MVLLLKEMILYISLKKTTILEPPLDEYSIAKIIKI